MSAIDVKFRKLLGDKVLGVLTSEQRALWETMTGKAFEFDANVQPLIPGPREQGRHHVFRKPG